MMESPNVRLTLVSRPENVVLIRDVLAGLGDCLDLGGTVEDIKAAVSEAANNVVVHAYGDREGPMEVEIGVAGRELAVTVRDHGIGIGPRKVDDSHPGRGIGLAVIEALAASCELRAHAAGPGVEVAMTFDVPAQPELGGLPQHVADGDLELDRDEALEMAIAPATLSTAIFDRVVTGLAARAGFSIDRLSDVQLVVDALTARIVPALTDDHVRLGATARSRGIELRVSPLRAGGSLTLVADSAIAELGPVIERLADEVAMQSDGAGEVLELVLRDRRPERGRSTPAGASELADRSGHWLASDARSAAPSASSSLRSVSSVARSSLETCICDRPTRSAISLCVSPSMKRRRTISRSRGASVRNAVESASRSSAPTSRGSAVISAAGLGAALDAPGAGPGSSGTASCASRAVRASKTSSPVIPASFASSCVVGDRPSRGESARSARSTASTRSLIARGRCTAQPTSRM